MLEGADDEHVRVVPAFPQCGVGEDEAHWLVQCKQALLVLEDEVVGIDVVGLRRARRCVRVHQASFLVDGEVAFVRLRRFDGSQIAVVWRVLQRESLVKLAVVFFLEDPRVFAGLLAGIVVATVLGHFVDEEQREHFDPLREKRLFLVEMRFDCLADLDAAEGTFIHVSRGLARLEHHAVGEAYGIVQGVNIGDDKAPVLFQAARLVVEVVISAKLAEFPFDSPGLADFKFHARFGWRPKCIPTWPG